MRERRPAFSEYPRRELIELARLALKRLAQEPHEDVGLSVLQGTHAVIIDRVEGPQPLKIMEVLDQSVPLYCGAFSKVLLAFQDREFIDKYLVSTKLVRFTPMTITSKKVLREELRAIRKLATLTPSVSISLMGRARPRLS